MEGYSALPPGSQRLKDVLDLLVDLKIVHSQTHFGDIVGVSKGNMSKYLSGSKEPKEDLLGRVVQAVQPLYPALSAEWLKTGEGPMLRDASPSKPKIESNARAVLEGEMEWVEVPLMPYKARAGVLAGFGDPDWQEGKQTMVVLLDRRVSSDYMIYEVEGDSMDDGTNSAFLDGDFLLCRILPQSDWQYGIKKRRDTFCVVATDGDGIVLKQVTRHDKAEGVITCHSLNPDYSDYDVSLADVQAIFYVEALAQRRL